MFCLNNIITKFICYRNFKIPYNLVIINLIKNCLSNEDTKTCINCKEITNICNCLFITYNNGNNKVKQHIYRLLYFFKNSIDICCNNNEIIYLIDNKNKILIKVLEEHNKNSQGGNSKRKLKKTKKTPKRNNKKSRKNKKDFSIKL